MSLNQSLISDFSEYHRWSQRTNISQPKVSVVRLTDGLDMTRFVDWDVKPPNKPVKTIEFRYFGRLPPYVSACDGSECLYLSPVKRICVFKHSVTTNFNCACPAIQRGQGSGFLSECSSWLTACMSEQCRFWRDCADAQARLNLRCSHMR